MPPDGDPAGDRPPTEATHEHAPARPTQPGPKAMKTEKPHEREPQREEPHEQETPCSTATPRPPQRWSARRGGPSGRGSPHRPGLTFQWSGRPTAQAWWRFLAQWLWAAAHRGRSASSPPARKGTFLCRFIATLRSVLYALSIHQHRRQGSRAMEAAAPITTYRLTDHA